MLPFVFYGFEVTKRLLFHPIKLTSFFSEFAWFSLVSSLQSEMFVFKNNEKCMLYIMLCAGLPFNDLFD